MACAETKECERTCYIEGIASDSGRPEHGVVSVGRLLVEWSWAGNIRLQGALSVTNLAFILQAAGSW